MHALAEPGLQLRQQPRRLRAASFNVFLVYASYIYIYIYIYTYICSFLFMCYCLLSCFVDVLVHGASAMCRKRVKLNRSLSLTGLVQLAPRLLARLSY